MKAVLYHFSVPIAELFIYLFIYILWLFTRYFPVTPVVSYSGSNPTACILDLFFLVRIHISDKFAVFNFNILFTLLLFDPALPDAAAGNQRAFLANPSKVDVWYPSAAQAANHVCQVVDDYRMHTPSSR